ncbi:AzlD domain-containing protein [Kribbella sp. NPDC003505]|uniref:AzlD domain-containing protein n=1 Tax=Kribbella sp. NPDC003505 TaxID=3154448 RepID=UPI0033A1A559
MTALLALLALGAISWVLRIIFITLVPADRLPARLRDGLEYLAPAVLSSIIAVELMRLVHDAESLDLTILLAGAATIGWVAHRTRNISLACGLGVAVVLILDYAPL